MTTEHRELTLEEFHTEIKAQGVEKIDYAFVCPMCETVQSARVLIAAGAGNDFDEVEGYLGFSCIGRFTGAGDTREKGKGCNWTLGGLFQTHTLTVITPDDNAKHPRFEIATPEQAKELRLSQGVVE